MQSKEKLKQAVIELMEAPESREGREIEVAAEAATNFLIAFAEVLACAIRRGGENG